MAKILITGGSGLIGWRVTERLVADGHDVVVYDLRPNYDNLAGLIDKISVEVGDVTDLPRLLGTMTRHAIDHVIHLAAFIPQYMKVDPAGAFRVNTIGTTNIFDCALALKVKRVVWTSTQMVKSAGDDYANSPVDEDWPIVSADLYGASKYGAEVIAKAYRRDLGLDSICIRPSLTYGVGRLGGGAGIFNEGVRDMALGRPATILPSRTKHQPMYNRDMAKLLVAALLGPPTEHCVFNTPTVEAFTDDEMLDVLRSLCPNADVSALPFPDYVSRYPVMDGSRARREIPFEPSITLKEGLTEMIELFRAQARAA